MCNLMTTGTNFASFPFGSRGSGKPCVASVHLRLCPRPLAEMDHQCEAFGLSGLSSVID